VAIQKPGNLLTVKEVAEYLRCHEQTVYKKMKTGEIPKQVYFRLGRDIRFDFPTLQAWHKQEVQPEIINYQPPINVVAGNGKISKKE